MDINLMVIGIGNSRLHVGAIVAGELRHVRHIPHAQQSDWPTLLGEVWNEIAGHETAEVAACSVVPEKIEALEHAVERAAGKTVQWVGNDLDIPIPVTTKEPKQTGVDRALVSAAAFEQLGKACVVVDAGTAITINLCNDSGALVGGAIMPGVALMLESLHAGTSRLPHVDFQPPQDAYGTDTAGAIRHGITASIRGLVQAFAERWAEQQGTWPEVIATGGDAHALFDDWEIVHAVSPDLLLYGIALAYTNHHIKHGT